MINYKHKHKHLLRNGDKGYHLSIMARLGLSSLAAVLNIFVTLPLDVLSTRKQIGDGGGAVADEAEVTRRDVDVEFYDCNEEEKKDDVIPTCEASQSLDKQQQLQITKNNNTNVNISNIPRPLQSRNKKSSLENFLSLWSGIGPSIILCSNPAIHYTFYDVIKLSLLQKKKNHNDKLSMNEAFCIGFAAKLLATIVTYPFIRTKVILMAGRNDVNKQDNVNAIIQSIPFLRILTNMYREEGIANGLYKGCMLQIIHTALKSAIVMMMKERVTSKVQSILG